MFAESADKGLPKMCFLSENLQRIQATRQYHNKFYKPVDDAIEKDGASVGEKSQRK